ncbi:MAG: RNA methyltransferase [Lachnospiraceae bacterium]|jgi:TrmH family RNA methyltransferase|nr:RNA methyltransferase [Lachnospiraceae bacterium]
MFSFKDIRELQKDSKARRMLGLFIAEGIKMFREAPKEDIEAVYASETFAAENEAALAGTGFISVPDERFAGLSDTRTPQGILTVLKQKAWTAEEILSKKNPFVLLLENLQDPGNAGTILRTAEAAGADGVFLTKGSVDIYNPKTIRSTMGSVYRMPHVYVDDVRGLLEMFMMKDVRTYAAFLDAPAGYLSGDYREGTAFLIGNESSGLTPELVNLSDRVISIPMKGSVESLNAAMAAGILMFEAARQRGAE